MGPSMSFGVCSQCGYSHPPIPDGARCPMAKDKTTNGQIIEYEPFFISLKNVITSQVQQKNIKDTKKLLGNIIMEVVKYMDTYKEE